MVTLLSRFDFELLNDAFRNCFGTIWMDDNRRITCYITQVFKGITYWNSFQVDRGGEYDIKYLRYKSGIALVNALKNKQTC